jgi:Domain of unknown function (DUF222)
MTTAAHEPAFVFDVVYEPAPSHRHLAARAPKERAAAALQLIGRKKAQDAAAEAEFILRLAALCPDSDDPLPDHPGAKKTYWRSARSEFPGVSEFFVDELGAVLGVGRGTAAHKAARAFTWRDKLPATFSALKCGDLDERRAQILADTLEHTRPALAGRVEAVVLPEAGSLGFTALKNRILALLLELDPTTADERRELAAKNADVWVEPGADGMATLGSKMPAEEAAEGFEFINTVAQMAKADGDPRPIGQIRTEIHSLLIRGAAIGAHGARTVLTITAALEALEGTCTQPADVNGSAITPAHLIELLRRVGALGLTTPADGGELTFAVTDADGRILATLSLAALQQAVKKGEGANPPAATDAYTPTAKQSELVNTRDRGCRWPYCPHRAGWADHDHVIPHACGGETTCTNLCCLCRSHHRLKTLAKGWLLRMEPDGTLHVTTPSGVTRTTKPWAMRRRPPPEPPPDPDPPPF